MVAVVIAVTLLLLLFFFSLSDDVIRLYFFPGTLGTHHWQFFCTQNHRDVSLYPFCIHSNLITTVFWLYQIATSCVFFRSPFRPRSLSLFLLIFVSLSLSVSQSAGLSRSRSFSHYSLAVLSLYLATFAAHNILPRYFSFFSVVALPPHTHSAFSYSLPISRRWCWLLLMYVHAVLLFYCCYLIRILCASAFSIIRYISLCRFLLVVSLSDLKAPTGNT